jgi:hypothetical protein
LRQSYSREALDEITIHGGIATARCSGSDLDDADD